MKRIKSFFIALSLTITASSCSLFSDNQNEVGTEKPSFDFGDVNGGVKEDTSFPGLDVGTSTGGSTSGSGSGSSSGGSSSTEEESKPQINKYTVLFELDDGTVLGQDEVEEGRCPKYNGNFPTKQSDEEGVSYTFVGWNEDSNVDPSEAIKTEDLPVVYYDTIYFAIFSDAQVQVSYQIAFINEDTLLGSPISVNHGDRPKYTGSNPIKEDLTDSGIIYTFVGWHTNPNATPEEAYNNDSLPFATQDNTYYAIYSSYNKIKYLITFKNGDENVGDPIFVDEGTRPTCPADPSMDDLVYEDEGKKIVFQFIGWHSDPNSSYGYTNENIPFATKEDTYYAIYNEVTYYLVSFYNEGTLLHSNYIESGKNPSYPNPDPTKVDTTNSGVAYSFVGWSDDQWADSSQAIKTEDLPVVSKMTDYYAIFTSATITYTITFKNGNDLLGDPISVIQGTRPQYGGDKPTRTDTTGSGIVYNFVGWHTNPDAAPHEAYDSAFLPVATKDDTYYAIFSSSVVKYNVIFKKDQTTVLYVDEDVAYGKQPKYEAKAPKINPTESNGITTIYKFAGWSEDPNASSSEAIKTADLPGVIKNTTYFAIFGIESSNKAKYLITFLMNDGSELSSDYVFYDDVPEYNGIEPSIDDYWFGSEKTTYEFVGWHENPNISSSQAIKTEDLPKAKKTTTYYAIFSKTTVTITYTITFKNGDDNVGDPLTINHGRKPIFVGEPPVRENEEIDGVTCLYTFAGWSEDPHANASTAFASDQLPVASKDTVYFAIYSLSTINVGLDKSSVELDCGVDRSIASSDSNIKGKLEPVFPQSAIISCDYTLSGHLSESDIKVNWKIDRNKYNYWFSMEPIEDEEGRNNSVKVTAKVQGHISYLDADIVLASDESTILKTITCRLKSVMTFIHKVSDYSRTTLAGEDVSPVGSGYEVSFYNDSYGFTLHGDNNDMGGIPVNVDLIIPSKVKVDGVIKPVVCLDRFANTDGSSYYDVKKQFAIDALVIPDSIIHIRGDVFSRTSCGSGEKSKDSSYYKFTFDFETKENGIILIEKGNFNSNIVNTTERSLLRFICATPKWKLDKRFNGTGFPFNSYVITDADSDSHDDMISFYDITYDIILTNSNNPVLWKKVSSS